MEQPREPGPPPAAGPSPEALDVDEEARPATAGDLRSLRRWLAVAGVWAVAATAIAVIALIEAGDDEPEEDTAAAVSRQVSRVHRQLDRRLDSVESQIRELPQSEDVSRLDRRLREVEDDVTSASRSASRAREGVSDLEQRVDDLEEQQEQGGTDTTPGGGGQTP